MVVFRNTLLRGMFSDSLDGLGISQPLRTDSHVVLKVQWTGIHTSNQKVSTKLTSPLHGVDLVAVERLVCLKDKNSYTSGKYFTYR